MDFGVFSHKCGVFKSILGKSGNQHRRVNRTRKGHRERGKRKVKREGEKETGKHGREKARGKSTGKPKVENAQKKGREQTDKIEHN